MQHFRGPAKRWGRADNGVAIFVAIAFILFLARARGVAAGAGSAKATVDFNREIRPILSDNCYACHGPDAEKRKAGLRLDKKEGALAELKSGNHAIVPGDTAKSTLVFRITTRDEDDRMPPAKTGKHLSAPQVELLRRWIVEGARFKNHWSFIAPERAPLPEVRNQRWPRNPIDYFILARMERDGLSPAPEADKKTLIRRVTFDLTGLPPTLAEVDAFLDDRAPDAYDRLLDRLLASPRYGEHLARYWLDVARYGDTHGLHLDNERSLWPYRDWVINAFNRNLPFDEFTIEQLAGDLLPSPTREQKVATGFSRCNVSTSEGGAIDEEFHVRYAVDRTETMSTVWMGLTTGCAVCHDHKFDPVTQKEFYQLYAFFNNVSEAAMDGNALLPPPIMQLPTAQQESKRTDLDARIALSEKRIQDELAKVTYAEPPALENAVTNDTAAAQSVGSGAGSGGGDTNSETKVVEDRSGISLAAWEAKFKAKEQPEVPGDVKKVLKIAADKRSEEQSKKLRDYYLAQVYAPVRGTFDPLVKERDALKQEREDVEKGIYATMIMAELEKPKPAFVLRRGEYDQRGDQVPRGVPAILPPLPASSTTNRLDLARWLVSRDHPLTARVTVNRLWQQFFGTGLVKTAADFGAQGEWPTHPELLDWLACEFRDGPPAWDVKRFVRLIVTSAAYRQSSQVTPKKYQLDPENRLLARGPRFRLDAEEIRDNALFTSGLLVEKVGGKSVRPYQPEGIWEAVGYTTSNTAKFTQEHGDALYRRSLYTFWKRTAPPPSLLTFDAPSRERFCVRRERTDTPLQALVTMNDPQYVEAARHLAERILRHSTDVDERLEFGFRTMTARTPSKAEQKILSTALTRHLARYTHDTEAASKLIAVGESPAARDFEPGELAAYTMLASLLLNLDETLNKN